MTLEVVVLPVADVDRTKHFYPCSITFGTGITSARPAQLTGCS
jgi:hypothetical protein